MVKPEPGSFFTPELDPYQNLPEHPEQARAFGPETSEMLQKQLAIFKDSFNPAAKIIYYPCCQNDTTISTVFPNSRIIYSDINKTAIAMLKQHGFEAHEADAKTFQPDAAPDIVMLQNPSIEAEGPAATLKEGGYLICNNYHSTANQIHGSKDFEIVGAVVSKGANQTVLDHENLQDYFTPISTDEELKKLVPGWGSVLTYESALHAIKELGDAGAYERVVNGETGVLDEYKKLAIKYADKKDPDSFLTMISWSDTNGVFYMIETNFPPKKGGADDLFIFQRKSAEQQKAF